jgi:hypothetical protein
MELPLRARSEAGSRTWDTRCLHREPPGLLPCCATAYPRDYGQVLDRTTAFHLGNGRRRGRNLIVAAEHSSKAI